MKTCEIVENLENAVASGYSDHIFANSAYFLIHEMIEQSGLEVKGSKAEAYNTVIRWKREHQPKEGTDQ